MQESGREVCEYTNKPQTYGLSVFAHIFQGQITFWGYIGNV